LEWLEIISAAFCPRGSFTVRFGFRTLFTEKLGPSFGSCPLVHSMTLILLRGGATPN